MDKTKVDKSNQDADLKPHPTPPIATAVDKLPIDKIKLPSGFKAEVWSSGHPGARTMVMGDKGTMFMGTRVIGRVYAITEKGGKREAKVIIQGPDAAERARLQGRLALRVRDQQGVPLRQDRGQSRTEKLPDPVELTKAYDLPDTDPPQLEIRGVRAGRQDVRAGRLELQHLRNQSRHPRPDPPLQCGRHRHGDRGARHPQHGGLRLASGDQGVVVHRQRPRLGRQRRTGRRAQPHSEEHGRRELRLPVLPRHGHSPIRTSSVRTLAPA